MSTMYDVVAAGNAPEGGDAYAGYIDGNYQCYQGLVARFPGKPVVPITVLAAVGLQYPHLAYDAEPGNAGPASVAAAVAQRHAHGLASTIYCSEWYAQIVADLAANLLAFTAPAAWPAAPGVYLWNANWTYQPHIDPGAVATQWTDQPPAYDTSLCQPAFPHLTPQPSPAPTPTPPKEDELTYVISCLNAEWQVSGNTFRWLPSAESAAVAQFLYGTAQPKAASFITGGDAGILVGPPAPGVDVGPYAKGV